jgi:hypothetical protein
MYRSTFTLALALVRLGLVANAASAQVLPKTLVATFNRPRRTLTAMRSATFFRKLLRPDKARND